tara:strand:+ start:651 stop:3665 length:3015 start_codon:yes stop_codon:yes gene_type:complete
MAIIYTYPIVTPELRDLVVITDASDKNFTKQASIQDIIDLFYFDCSKCDYCTTSINKIIPSVGEIVESTDCDTGINFTSSDASVTITGNNTTKTIDFKGAGGGGGGCPTTYIIKPVTCEGTDCLISEKENEWIYTCDEALGALAPGYINDLSITGVAMTSASGCWYIEEFTISASSSTCLECCPGGDTYTFKKCGVDSYVTLDVDPAIPTGQVLERCCPGDPGVSECWEYIGNVGLPVGPGFDPACDDKGFHLDCDCCNYKCVVEYTACEPNTSGLPAQIYYDTGLDVLCNCVPEVTEVVFSDDITAETWCYILTGMDQCQPPTSGYSLIAEAGCGDADYCAPSTFTWRNCDAGPDVVVSEHDVTITPGTILKYCTYDEIGGEHIIYCYEYLGQFDAPLSGSLPVGYEVIILGETPCECCKNYCHWTYTICPGEYPPALPASVVIDLGYRTDPPFCECNDAPSNIGVRIGEDGWCYQLAEQSCDDATEDLTWENIGDLPCTSPEYCPTTTFTLRWKSCSDEGWLYEDPLNPIGGDYNTPGNHYVGQLNTDGVCITPQCCIEVEEVIDTGEPVTSWDTWIIDTSCDTAYSDTYAECDCCIYADVVTYTACEDGCEIEGVHYPTISIDVCAWGAAIGEPAATPGWKPDTAPEFIKIGDCCYQKGESPCAPETLTTLGFNFGNLTYDAAFGSCDCEGLVKYQWKNCDDVDWIDTESNLSAYLGSAWFNAEDCIEVQIGGTGIGAPIDLSTSIEYEAGLGTACECCKYRDIYTYNKCGLSDLPDCGSMPATVNLDSGGAPLSPLVIVTDTINGWACCYELQEEQPCDAATPNHTFVAVSGECADGELAPECLAPVEEEKWVYTSCNGCDDLVSTTQFHPDGDLSFWYDCCWYEVPAGTTLTLAADNVPPDVDVYFLTTDCATASSFFPRMKWVNCLDVGREIYWDCECEIDFPYAVGTTLNGLTGFDNNGDPVVVSDCWEIIEPTPNPASEITCTSPTIVACGEDPCL